MTDHSRRLVAAALSLAAGCGRDDAPAEFCEFSDLGEIRVDEVGRVGVRPTDAVAGVDGASLDATFLPSADGLDSADAFSSTVSVHIQISGAVSEREYAGGPEGDVAASCPTGPVMIVPVRVQLELGVGGSTDGEGTLSVMGPSPDQTFLDAPAPPLLATAGWLQEAADRVGCQTCDRPLTVRLGLSATPALPASRWSAPSGYLNILGEGATVRSSEVFYDFHDAVVHPPRPE